jgi:DNA-directed RNA polymerase specialized sigma24 family protein
MEKGIFCKYNSRMNLYDFLAVESHYLELFHEGEREARRRLVFQPEEADDVVSEALENLLDYFSRKPEKVFALENMEDEKMKNYLKKAMRHQVINIVKKRNRRHVLRMDDLAFSAMEIPAQRGLVDAENNAVHGAGFLASSHTSLDQLREELHFFIEEKFGRERWKKKKDAVDLFMERIGKNMRIGDLQKKYPDANVAVMNAIAHRVIKKYSSWIQKNGRDRQSGNESRRGES